MEEFLNSFSNREISIVFWTSLIVILMFFNKVSASIKLIKAFFAKKLTYIYCLMSIYLGLVIYILKLLNLWESSLYKDFIFWIITSGLVMLFDFNNLKTNKDFKNIILKLLTINIIFEFIAGNYNFSLVKEFIIIPFAAFISILIVVAQQKEKENKIILKILNQFINFSGFVILIYILYQLIKSPLELFTIKNLKSFLFSPLFTILFIPFLFLVVAFSKYEQIYLNLNRYTFLSKKRKFKIKLALIKYGNLNLKYLENAYNITIWRKAELQNEKNIKSYIRKEIKKEVKFNG